MDPTPGNGKIQCYAPEDENNMVAIGMDNTLRLSLIAIFRASIPFASAPNGGTMTRFSWMVSGNGISPPAADRRTPSTSISAF
jgi:hypothetical protein